MTRRETELWVAAILALLSCVGLVMIYVQGQIYTVESRLTRERSEQRRQQVEFNSELTERNARRIKDLEIRMEALESKR